MGLQRNQREESKQFRSYDLNQCHITAEAFALSPQKRKWELTAILTGQKIIRTRYWSMLGDMTRMESRDDRKRQTFGGDMSRCQRPLTYYFLRSQKAKRRGYPDSRFRFLCDAHMFKATASNATSYHRNKSNRPIWKYSETMNRPKSLSVSYEIKKKNNNINTQSPKTIPKSLWFFSSPYSLRPCIIRKNTQIHLLLYR